jgi:tetratricopeptide (TPR) repeat protein
LHDTGFSAEEYVPLLRKRMRDAGLDEPTVQRHRGLVPALEVAFERISRIDSHAATLLTVLSILAPEPIPMFPISIEQATSTVHSFGLPLGEPEDAARIIRAIRRSGLAKVAGREVQLHRLIQLFLKNRQSRDEIEQLGAQAAKLLGLSCPGDPRNPEEWPNFAILAPHVEALASYRFRLSHWDDHNSYAQILLACVDYYYRSGRYAKGLQLAEGSIDAWAAHLGNLDVLTLRLKNNLGMCLTGLKHYDRAIQLYRSLYEQYAQVLGESDPLTLGARNNIGVTLNGAKRFNEAVEVLTPTLQDFVRHLGARHREALRTADNLAKALTWSCDWQEATSLARETLRLRREVCPSEHPDVLDSEFTLGLALASSDPYRSLLLLEKVHKTQRRVLGEDHTSTHRSARAIVRTREMLASREFTRLDAGNES